MLDIIITTSHKSLVRNDQLGDWHTDGRILVRVLEDHMPRESELAVAIHELIEAFLCERAKISDEEVCEFDANYEKERSIRLHFPEDEPGEDSRSPYRDEHMAANHVERAVCNALGLTWEQHCANCNGFTKESV